MTTVLRAIRIFALPGIILLHLTNKDKVFVLSLQNVIFLTSVLTFGIHGSAFPTSHPELEIDIPPAVNMDFVTDYLTNELQILLSDYTVNTKSSDV